jgi:hypothetical protein
MRNKEERILEECQLTCMKLKKIEDNLENVARIHEVYKFKHHVLEIEKIMYLTLGLKYRLSSIEATLDNLEWNGVDERYDLERRRDKLMKQLEEANYLKCCIDKQTGLIAGYIEHYLRYHDVVQFRELVKTRKSQIIEQKKVQKNVAEGKGQLQAMKVINE